MYQINTTTKKFTEAVTIDLGQLPTVDTRIDFILTDGTNPVIAENKTFAMTIGSVLGTLYKTDEDTVSFRYLKFNDDNIADSLVITMTMDGVEILNDVISLKYQRECIDKGALEEAINAKADKATTIAGYGITDAYTKTEIDAKPYATKDELSTVATTGSYNDLSNKPDLTTKLDAPAVAGTVGQVLTKTADGQEWADAPAGGGGEDTTDYLCFTATQANSTVRLDKVGTPPTISLEYSTDKKTWTEYTWDGTTGATITLTNIGDSVLWRGDNTWLSNGSSFNIFRMTGKISATGNIMSLLDKTCKSVTITKGNCFSYLFSGCSSLTTAPELPATTLAQECYKNMFGQCSSLIKAPELPATTLTNYCYQLMFSYCSSLTTAPELPATTLATDCYSSMFVGCSKLQKVKVPFTSWNGTYDWLSGASATGVFKCPSALDCSTRDVSHVPAGWTIVRTDSPKSITSPTSASSAETYEVSPNTADVPVVTVASALTLNAKAIDSGSVTYSEIVLDVASGATVTAGTNLTLVDTPTAGKRNICVCRWSGGVCKLYVTIVEDLPQA